VVDQMKKRDLNVSARSQSGSVRQMSKTLEAGRRNTTGVRRP
jgi:hypothetical protein